MKIIACSLLLLTLPAQPPPLALGPGRGHVDGTSMHVFAQAGAAGDYVLHLAAVVDGSEVQATASATPQHDLTLHFVVEGLEAGAAYTPWITCGDDTVLPRTGLVWTTAPGDDAARATLAFGSCSHDRTFAEQPIWGQLLARAPEALVLLGDTPYIDDGSVDGRRRRYRQFLAFAPVRATSAVLPIWTTWDDHDYATNDAFGAAKGSETARAVFVDYHAHATYGDGERGIYTRFRRGPIEVFLLDTRSFADTGPSPLAPGERTLLGAAQIAWLQAGLTASTAPCKVLACGMVWNEGVRPNKADCWGNWLAERDALFRWLGTAGIDGVVLLGGDVHRSRVILHPTVALAGYELPEFVTSPLAQNVIESNAVPVPGLEFDRGEPHSALLLTVDNGHVEPRLVATFVAGDGREFHRRELPLAALARPDAAAAYRRAAAMLRREFGDDLERLPEWQWTEGGTLPVEPDQAGSEEWLGAVAAAAPALAAFQEATQASHCTFAGRGSLADNEYVHRLFLPLQRLVQLEAAGALQAAAAGRSDAGVAAGRRLFAHARHVEDQGSLGWMVAASVERLTAALLQRIPDADAAAVLREHLAGRAPVCTLAPMLQTEVESFFGQWLAQTRLGDDAQAAIARRFEPQVSAEFRALVGPVFAALAALPDAPDDRARDVVRRAAADLAARGRDRLRQLAALDPTKVDPKATPTALAELLATVLVPDLDGLIDARLQAEAALRAAAEDTDHRAPATDTRR